MEDGVKYIDPKKWYEEGLATYLAAAKPHAIRCNSVPCPIPTFGPLPATRPYRWEVRINYFLGEGYRIAGDPRAATHLRNARNWAIDETWRSQAEFALGRLKIGNR